MNGDDMKIGICDDEARIRKLLDHKIRKYFFNNDIDYHIQMYKDGEDLLSSDFNEIDILFLDVDMPGIKGLETAKEIRKINKEMKIIFLTAYSEFVFESFKVDAFRYLVKPLKDSELNETLHAIEQGMEEPEEYFIFQFQNKTYSIKYSDIIYIEGMENKIWIHCKEETYRWRGKMKKLSETLKDKGFFYIHQSYIVNMKKIQKYDWQTVQMEDEIEIPISRHRLNDFKEEYIKLWSKVL